jgi:hypothetical protein
MGKYILDINDLDMDKTYTYADYIMWKFQERVELFKGKIMRMSPAPNVAHQKISANIFNNFYTVFFIHRTNYFTVHNQRAVF